MTPVKLLENALSVKVYPDYVPEGEQKPAVAYFHTGHSSERQLSGRKVGNMDVWRVTIVGSTIAQLDSIRAELELLDNTSNNEYRNIFTKYITTEPKQVDAPFRRAFVDIELRLK